VNDNLHAELNTAIDAVLGQLHDAVETMHRVMLDERAALDTGKADALDDATSFKQSLLRRIESLDAERKQLGKQAGIDTAAHALWPEIVDSLARCKQLNLVNGGIVTQRLKYVRKALGLLTGHSEISEIYGPTGEARSATRSAQLARA
jgi:flagella synthesis protein FlgN